MIGTDWRYDFPEEKSDELMHYGKKGMKWGKRNAVGSKAAPSLGRSIAGAALLPVAGLQKQSRYKNANALKNRKAAGQNIVTGLLMNVGAMGLNVLASSSGNASVRAGASTVARLMGVAGTVTATVGAVQNVAATVQENKSRKG